MYCVHLNTGCVHILTKFTVNSIYFGNVTSCGNYKCSCFQQIKQPTWCVRWKSIREIKVTAAGTRVILRLSTSLKTMTGNCCAVKRKASGNGKGCSLRQYSFSISFVIFVHIRTQSQRKHFHYYKRLSFSTRLHINSKTLAIQSGYFYHTQSCWLWCNKYKW